MRIFVRRITLAVIALLLFSFSNDNLYAQGVMQQAIATAPFADSTHRMMNNGTGVVNEENTASGQQYTAHKQNGAQNAPGNYKTFSKPVFYMSNEAITANAGYEHHPELGLLYEGAPCANCYELIGERTENTKTFYKEGKSGEDGGKDVMVQTSTGPLHYKDANGNWITIKTLLQPGNEQGVYAAMEQPVPVVINTNAGNNFSSLGKKGESFQFNHNLELIYAKPDGSEVSLGVADWANHTAGDDGVYVTNAWPGVDIEMHTHQGAVKTNFYINHPMPEYAAGKLLLRDHLQMDGGLSLFTGGKTQTTDNLEIRNRGGEKIYEISSVIACEKNDVRNTLHTIDYYINGSILDIAVPGTDLNKPASEYPVIIDPLVSSGGTSVAVGGSTYSAALAAMSGCLYTDNAVVPANITITDIRFAFIYTTSGGAWLDNGFTDFYLNTCRSPAPPTGLGGLYWYCNGIGPGTCTADGTQPYSLLNDFTACVPAPQCPTYTLPIKMYFYEDYLTHPACGTTYVTSASNLTITVYGHTVEIKTPTATATTICLGQSTTLSVGAATVAGVAPYTVGPFTTGVPPYTYSWMPGGLTGSPVTVSPTTTTTYTATVTDACGITATSTITITVDIVDPITGTLSLCVGNTSTLADATGGAHTWISSNPGVATITSPGGIVTAIAAGTTTITYTSTATGCTATAIVTVTPLPTAILGTLTVCSGNTTTLSDATAGLPWSSSNTAVATISGTGVVAGVASGTSTITYGSATCYVTAIVTVTVVPAITGTLSLCVGGTTTLADGATGTWSSGTTGVATIGAATGVVTGVSAGTSVITFTTATSTVGVGGGCTVTAIVTVNPVSPITGTLSLCAGGTTALANAVAGGTWSSSSTGVATIGLTTGLVTGVANGTTTIIYTTAAGCTSTAVVTVNPVSPITGVLSVCEGNTTTLANAVAGGTWSSGTTAVATIGLTTGIVSGVSGGTSTIVYTTAAGCTSTAVVTVNPVSPITGTFSLCAGSTTTLANTVAGGTWSSSATGVATIGLTTGLVTTIANGTTTIVYTTAAGCTSSVVLTVNVLAAISGTLTICQGSTTTLSEASGTGTWGSSNTAVATAGATTGIITGITPGTSTITFLTAAGCSATAVVTVEPATPITGTTTLCAGNTTTLMNATTGGTWSSTNTAVATITAGSGVVSALSAGVTTITYQLPSGCYATTTFTVINVAAITGTPKVCVGSTTTLNDATTGGTWNSSNAAVATIGLGTGVVSGISGGTSLITYTSGGGCTTTITVTVDPLPAAITGVANVCVGLTTTLSDVTAGGTWSSSNTAVASISATGVITGVSAGSMTITYQLPTGCNTTIPVVVNPLPAAISGPADVCVGSSINLSDALTGGTWVSSNTAAAGIDASTGVVTGLAAGVTTITYTLVTGCLITTPVTVVPVPSAPVTQNVDYCQNSTALTLTATGSNLLWFTTASGGTGVADTTPQTSVPGVVTWYVTQTVNGCESPRAMLTVTVHTSPVFNIVPARPMACQNDTISYYSVGPTFAGETYAWSLPSNGFLSGGSSLYNSSILMYFDTTLGSNIVTLTVGDGYAPCNVTKSIPINVYLDFPQASFYVKPNVCLGDSVTIALSNVGPDVVDFTWNFDGASVLVSSSNHGGPFIVTWPAPGIYTVSVTAISNLSCPSAPIIDTIEVHPYPDAQIATPIVLDSVSNTLCLGDSILLSALNYVAEDMYVWAPAHFFEQRNENRVYGTIQLPGYVYLTVTDPFGCVATDSVLFNAQSCCQVLFPNAFTPNGDHKNDLFRPITDGHHTVHEFIIVNRWGQTVYESSNETGAWDGNFNGVPQDIGVYNYYFKYDCNGKTMEEHGDVTLIR